MTRPPRPDGLDPKSQAARTARGRPMVAISMSVVTLTALDGYCERHGLKRGDAIAKLLGVPRKEKSPPQP